jgi:hypothetical protein
VKRVLTLFEPYSGGQRVVNRFLGTPGGKQGGTWPQCVMGGVAVAATTTPQQLHDQLAAQFLKDQVPANSNGRTTIANTVNRCGSAFANAGFTSALVTQPGSLTPHGSYMYSGPLGGTIVQLKLGTDVAGRTTYRFRTYLTGVSLTTGIGVADDLGSLMVMADPSAVGLSGQEAVTKTPLCEDMQ